MRDKIIFWQDGNFINFGIAKLLQEKYDCDMYAIINITDKPKRFFQEQQIVKYKKFWFYHDCIQKNNQKLDLEYLKQFELKYGLNLWLLSFNERFFYNFNEFYKFSPDEILKILEQECKLFDSILEEVRPDFLIMATPNFHFDHLFYKMCDVRGIKIMILRQTRFGFRCMISKEMDKIDFQSEQSIPSGPIRTLEELLSYRKGFDLGKEMDEYKTGFMASKLDLIKAVIQLLISKNRNVKTHYTYYGRTKLRVLVKSVSYSLRTKIRESFINRTFVKKIDENNPFVYFPLHVDQEHTMLIGAPFYTNQLEVIRHILKSLPIGYKLYVKEHPLMNSRSWREISFYKQIMALPNVVLVHPSVSPEEIMKKCSLVIAILGTSSMEAAFYGKPSISFVDLGLSLISSVYKLNSIEDLPEAIRTSLTKKINLSELNKYVNLIDKNSFEFNYSRAFLDYSRFFYIGGYLVDIEITNDKMQSYIEKNRNTFDFLADEHIKKIKQHKEFESKT